MAESCFHKSLKKLQDFFMLKTIINYYKKKKGYKTWYVQKYPKNNNLFIMKILLFFQKICIKNPIRNDATITLL